MTTVGKHIKSLRIRREIKLNDLAEATKINVSVLSRIERDERFPTVNQIKALSAFFNIPDEILLEEYYSDKILSILGNRDDYKGILNNVEIKIEALKRKKKYFIRKSGKNDFVTYYLIHSESFEMLDLFFDSYEDAMEYAVKNNLEIVKYDDFTGKK